MNLSVIAMGMSKDCSVHTQGFPVLAEFPPDTIGGPNSLLREIFDTTTKIRRLSVRLPRKILYCSGLSTAVVRRYPDIGSVFYFTRSRRAARGRRERGIGCRRPVRDRRGCLFPSNHYV